VDIQVARLAKRLTDRRLTLHVADDAHKWLAELGYDPMNGDRPVRRLIQSAIGDQLAKELLAGAVRDGDTVSVRTAEDGSGLVVART
jgi:ATP-dependent Clp protease ATP-binding subunit ClpB